MDFSVNIQQLKKCKSMEYFSSYYDFRTGETTVDDFEPYDHFTWDLETHKRICKECGVEYSWWRYSNTHPISGQLSDLWIDEGMLHMIVDGNLLRIMINIFDEFNEYSNSYSFFYDGGDEFVHLNFYK